MIVPPIPLANVAVLLGARELAKEIRAYAPLAFQTGGETWFEGSAVVVCADGATWNQVWDLHIKNEAIGNQRIGNLNPAPAVDFRRNLVVAMFAGPTPHVVGYRAVSGYLFGKEGTLRLVPVVDNSRGSAIALPSPWAFIVLPRTNASIAIQLPQNGGWTTVATVPPSL